MFNGKGGKKEVIKGKDKRSSENKIDSKLRKIQNSNSNNKNNKNIHSKNYTPSCP